MCNVSDLCRLCASSQVKVIPIFGEDGESQSLADKIHTHLPIVVTPEDCMPTTVCSDCVSALNICHNLLRSCVAADERLRQLLGFEEDPDHTSALDELKKVTHSSECSSEVKEDNANYVENENDNGKNDTAISERDDSDYIYDEVVEAVDENGHPVFLKQEVMEVEDEDLAKTLEGDEVVVVMLEYDPDQESEGQGVFIQENSADVNQEDSATDSKKLHEIKFNENVSIQVPDFKWTSLLMCDKCGDPFRSLKQLFQHKMYAHHVKDPLECPACNHLSSTKRDYVEHVREHLPDSPLGLICPICSRESKSRELLKHHLKGHANANSLDCQICTVSCKDRLALEKHLEAHADQQNEASLADKRASQQWVCHECGYTCSRSLNLQRHLMRHEREKSSDPKKSKGKKTSECRVCGKTFESFWYLVRHRTDEHTREEVEAALQEQGLERESFECNICGKLLSCQYTLNHHLEGHSDVRNFHCEYCDKSFAYKAQLKSHTLIHTGSQYTCSDCPKQFRNAYALRVHRRTHTGEKPFQCEQCPKAFHSRANYEQHLQIHSEVRKYKCNYCAYRARRPEALKTHIRTHTNERPYACKVCGRAFKQKYDCKKHEDLHYRNPGAFLKQRWPKSSKSTITIIEQDSTGNAPVESKDLGGPEPSIRIVQIEDSGNMEETNIEDAMEAVEESAEEATTEITEVTEEEAGERTDEGVTKLYEYHEGGVREIVISQVSLADEEKPTVWRVPV